MRVQFNTGRQYTEAGQVVVVEYDPANPEVARFNDTSRMINGAVAIIPEIDDVGNPRALARIVMDAYDRGNYTNEGTWEAPKFNADEPTICI